MGKYDLDIMADDSKIVDAIRLLQLSPRLSYTKEKKRAYPERSSQPSLNCRDAGAKHVQIYLELVCETAMIFASAERDGTSDADAYKSARKHVADFIEKSDPHDCMLAIRNPEKEITDIIQKHRNFYSALAFGSAFDVLAGKRGMAKMGLNERLMVSTDAYNIANRYGRKLREGGGNGLPTMMEYVHRENMKQKRRAYAISAGVILGVAALLGMGACSNANQSAKIHKAAVIENTAVNQR